MDDLTIIDGIGPATSRALAAAGIATMAALAAVDPAAPPVDLPRADWAAWVAEARKRIDIGAALDADRGSASASDASNTPEGRSGTAREAPSTDSGTAAETPTVGPQAAAPNSSDAPGGPVTSVLVVRGPQAGRRRAGRRFGPEPVRIPLEQLDAEQVAAIEGDPLLSTSREEA